MWWHYALVFICSMAVDIVPFPLPPAFTVMIVLQIVFKLNIWVVIVTGCRFYCRPLYSHFIHSENLR